MDSLPRNAGLLTRVVSNVDTLCGDVIDVVIDHDAGLTVYTTPSTCPAGREAVDELIVQLERVAPSAAWHEGEDDPAARAELLAALLAHDDGGES